MPVRSSAGDEPEVLNERRESQDVFIAVAGMLHLDSVQTLVNESLDTLASSRLRRVSDDGEATGTMDQRDRVLRGQSFLRYIAGSARGQISVEGVTRIHGPSFGDQRPSDMRPTD